MPVQAVNISRTIQASPAEIFAAWTQPEWLKKWWCTPGYCFERIEIDPQPSGFFRYELVPEPGQVGPTCLMEGIFEDVRSQERINCSWTIRAADFIEADTRLQVTFVAVDGGTQVTVHHDGFASEEGRQLHETDWDLVLSKLNQVFESLSAPVSVHSNI